MKKKYGSILNKNSASKYTEININVNKFCYYFYLNCCVDGYKYIVLNDTQQDATRKDFVAASSFLAVSLHALYIVAPFLVSHSINE
jgi:hypothetical protein